MESKAIESGIRSDEYWLMTFSEIMIQVEANQNRYKDSLKQKAASDYKLAQLIAYAFNNPKGMPKATDYYPILNEESAKLDDPKQIPQTLSDEYNEEEDKAIFMQMAGIVQKNAERKRGE